MTSPSARTDASILHVDLDAFYASVEQLLDPTLRGRPVIVGGIVRRGVVCAASYEARRFGVRSAMPSLQARKLCPDGVFVAPRMGVYGDYSKQVMSILRDTTPLVEQLSVDEAFCDVAGLRRLVGDGPTIGAELRTRIKDEVGLTASVGAATTKFLAKVASDRAKPDGLLVIEPGSELAFLHPLSVRALWGVGPKSAEKLDRLGIRTVGDLARLSVDVLTGMLGNAAGRQLHDLAHNRDPRPVVTDREAKSIGHEETFGDDLTNRADLERELLRLSESVAARLRAAKARGRTITLKAKYSDFTLITRAQTLEQSTDTGAVVLATARRLLDHVDCARGVRLIGVHCSNLVTGSEPLQASFDFGSDDASMPAPDLARRAEIERTMDDVRAKFGKHAIRSAALLETVDRPNPSQHELES